MKIKNKVKKVAISIITALTILYGCNLNGEWKVLTLKYIELDTKFINELAVGKEDFKTLLNKRKEITSMIIKLDLPSEGELSSMLLSENTENKRIAAANIFLRPNINTKLLEDITTSYESTNDFLTKYYILKKIESFNKNDYGNSILTFLYKNLKNEKDLGLLFPAIHILDEYKCEEAAPILKDIITNNNERLILIYLENKRSECLNKIQ